MPKNDSDETWYVNVVTDADPATANPECVTDEHLASLDLAIVFSEQFIRENPDVLHCEISSFFDGVGSDNVERYVRRDDVIAADRAGLAAAPRPLLVLVHPGSLCGSLNFNVGKFEARAVRDAIASDLGDWRGDLLVLDGALSDELKDYPQLAQAIDAALARAQENGIGVRLEADDPGHAAIAAAFIVPRYAPGNEITLTGAWYDPADRSGCVNSTLHALSAAGYTGVEVSDNAARDPDSDADDENDAAAMARLGEGDDGTENELADAAPGGAGSDDAGPGRRRGARP